MTLRKDLLRCPFCGSPPDVNEYGEVSCPIGLCSMEEKQDYYARSLRCGNDAVMTIDEWQMRNGVIKP